MVYLQLGGDLEPEAPEYRRQLVGAIDEDSVHGSEDLCAERHVPFGREEDRGAVGVWDAHH